LRLCSWGSLWGGMLYEFTMDLSPHWKPLPHAPIGTMVRFKPVWEDVRWAGQLEKLVIEPEHPEKTRKAILVLRTMLFPVLNNNDPPETEQEREKQVDLIKEKLPELDPELFSEFYVQWEIVQLRLGLMKRMVQLHVIEKDILDKETEDMFTLLSGQASLSVDEIGTINAAAERFPTEASFQEAVQYYETLINGPVRPIDMDNIEAVIYARKKLGPAVPYFVDSGQAHDVPPDILAGVAVTYLLRKAYEPSYGLLEGLKTTLDDGKTDLPESLVNILNGVLNTMPGGFNNIKVQDRAADFLGGIVGSASPTTGWHQIRAGRTTTWPREFNVKEDNLWSRWQVDATHWSNRQINARLHDPKWNI